MTEKRTVKVNGEELVVEINLNDDGSYEATVEGQTFTVEVPNAQAAPRARRGGGAAAGGGRRICAGPVRSVPRRRGAPKARPPSFFGGLSLLRAYGRREPRTDPPHATLHRILGAGSSVEDLLKDP